MLPPLTGLAPEEAEARFVQLGEPAYRARQVLRWAHARAARSFQEMTDLPTALRRRLAEVWTLPSVRPRRQHRSQDGTRKWVLELADGETIETVLIPEGARRTACISTQVGCPVGCVFCASGLEGLRRNLTAGEIVDQVLHVDRELAAGERVTHVVVMGIGEPLLNFGPVAKALALLHAPWGRGLGYNKITLSTAGIADKIPKLVEAGVTPNLAVSLHAANGPLRRRLVPHVRRWTLEDLVAAGVEYRRATGKDVTFEYVLLAGVNDSPEDARALGKLVAKTGCKVNAIPYNPVAGLPYGAPAQEAVNRFVAALGECGVPVTVRRRRGEDVAAACGQLRIAPASGPGAPPAGTARASGAAGPGPRGGR